MSKTTIDAGDDWRLKCPRGHSSIAPTNNHWWCRACANHWNEEADPEYDIAVEAKTGEEVSRDEIELDFEAPGVYYA